MIPRFVTRRATQLAALCLLPTLAIVPGTPPVTGDAAVRSTPVQGSIAPPMIEPEVGKEYFTRFTLREEKNKHNNTNYARGNLVPINTKVRLVEFKKNEIVLQRLDTDTELRIDNEDKYTKKTAEEFAKLLLASQETRIERLPSEIATAIKSGEMRKGMTKEQVLMARGYPPAHETPSTDGDRWVYWSSRYVKQTIVFQGGKLAEGRGII